MKQEKMEIKQQYYKYLKHKLAKKILENYKLKFEKSNLKNEIDTQSRIINVLTDEEKRATNNCSILYSQLEKITKQMEAYKAALNIIHEIVDTNCERNTKSLIECIRNLVKKDKPKEEQTTIEQSLTTESYWRVVEEESSLNIYHIPTSICKSKEEAIKFVDENDEAAEYIVENVIDYTDIESVDFVR